MIKEGNIFRELVAFEETKGIPFNDETKETVKNTVSNLITNRTTSEHPGMLLGKIQSGKTRTFLGVIALAADNEFKQFIVLTKGTRALTSQTYERMKKAFASSIEADEIRVFDIMTIQKLTVREQRLPIIIVVKRKKRI